MSEQTRAPEWAVRVARALDAEGVFALASELYSDRVPLTIAQSIPGVVVPREVLAQAVEAMRDYEQHHPCEAEPCQWAVKLDAALSALRKAGEGK